MSDFYSTQSKQTVNMNFVNCLIFVWVFLKTVSTFLNPQELQLSLDLMKELRIRLCIFVGNKNSEYKIVYVKLFTAKNLSTAYMNHDELLRFITNNEKIYFNTGLIFKEENLSLLENITQTLKEANESYKLQHYIWIIFLQNFPKKLPDGNELIIPYYCEFIIIQPKDLHLYELTEIYTMKTRQLTFDFATWNRDSGLQMTKINFDRRRLNLNGSEIGILYSLASGCEDIGPMHCQIYEILDGFCFMTNLKKVSHFVPRNEDRLVEFEKIGDILAHTMAFGSDGSHNYEKLPIINTILNWYIKHPSTQLRSDYYLQPFDIQLWFSLLLIISTTSVLMVILFKTKERFFIDDLFLGLESFCGQCGNSYFGTYKIRIIIISFRLTALILAALYGACITSFLSVEIPKPPFTNLKEFFDNGQYKVMIPGRGGVYHYLRDNHNPNMKKLSNNFTKYYDILNFEDLKNVIHKICYGKSVAYVYDNDIFKFDLPCRFFKIPEPIASMWLVLYFKENSPFIQLFNHNFVRFYENGISKRLKRSSLLYSTSKEIREDFLRPVTITQTYQVLMIPVIGIILGTVIIVLELIYQNIVQRNRVLCRNFPFNYTYVVIYFREELFQYFYSLKK